MFISLPYEYREHREIDHNPRDGLLYKFFMHDTYEEIHVNNLSNIEEIIELNDTINPLYEKDLASLNKEKISLEDLKKLYPEFYFYKMRFHVLDDDLLKSNLGRTISEFDHRDFYQEHAVTGNVSLVLKMKIKYHKRKIYEMFAMIFLSHVLDLDTRGTLSKTVKYTNQTREYIEENFLLPIDFRYFSDSEYKEEMDCDYG